MALQSKKPARRDMSAEAPVHHEKEPQKSEIITWYEDRWSQGKFVCVGLDPDLSHKDWPQDISKRNPVEAIKKFNFERIDATQHITGVYKPNSAFYEAYGAEGIQALKTTINYAKDMNPDVPIILDAKRGDIGNTNNGYVKFAFDYLGADAITVSPYLGIGALKPFLERKEKGVFVLCRTSNPEADEFQEFKGHVQDIIPDRTPLYQKVAYQVVEHWNRYYGNIGLVVGATNPEQLFEVSNLVDDLPLLIPGIGKQGGDLEAAVRAGDGRMFINSSSGIIFAENPEEEALKLHNRIRAFQKAE